MKKVLLKDSIKEIKNTYMGILMCKQHYVCRILRIHEYVGTYTRVYADFRKWRVLEGFI